MILKCNKTGRLFFSEDEAKAYADQFGNADFSEVAPDQKMWITPEGRPFFSESEIAQYKQRTQQPDLQTEELTVQAYGARLAAKDAARSNDARVQRYAKKKIMDALCEVKGYGQLIAEKACWFTENKSVAECEKWIEEHKNDEGIREPLRLAPGAAGPDSADGAAAAVEPEPGPKVHPVDENGEPLKENCKEVKEKIKPDQLQELLAMGFGEIRAEKALFYTANPDNPNAGLEGAVQWLTDHAEDADVDFPIATVAAPAPAKPKMSPEEAAQKALELQQRLKREREEREKQEAKDKEKARIAQTKLMQEANAELEAANRKRDFEQMKKEQEAHDAHAAELKEKLRLDYIERFGCEPPVESAEETVKEKPTREQIAFFINGMKKKYADTEPAKLKAGLTVLKAYFGNVQKDPLDKKFHKIKKENKAFLDKVKPLEGAVEVIDLCGFKDVGDFYEIQGAPDGFNLGQALKFIDLVLKRL